VPVVIEGIISVCYLKIIVTFVQFLRIKYQLENITVIEPNY